MEKPNGKSFQKTYRNLTGPALAGCSEDNVKPPRQGEKGSKYETQGDGKNNKKGLTKRRNLWPGNGH